MSLTKGEHQALIDMHRAKRKMYGHVKKGKRTVYEPHHQATGRWGGRYNAWESQSFR
jgi:hypothetical protein